MAVKSRWQSTRVGPVDPAGRDALSLPLSDRVRARPSRRGSKASPRSAPQAKMNAMLETPELPAVFDGVKLAAVAAVLYVIVRCLNLKSPTAPPDLYFQDSGLSRFLLKSCPLLTKE